MRDLIKALSVAGLLITSVARADAGSNREPIGGFDGLAFGQAPEEVDWLTAANWMQPGCPAERLYYLADADRRNFLAGVRLVWPGLLYRFLDNRLYAIQAEFPPGGGAFKRLRAYLVAKYGTPSMSESWQAAPRDTFVYQHRLNTVGWYAANGTQSIWLTAHDGGGSVIMIDSAVPDWEGQQLGGRCSGGRTDITASATSSPTGSFAEK